LYLKLKPLNDKRTNEEQSTIMDFGYFISTTILKETKPVAEGLERSSEAVGIVGLVTEPGN